MDTALIGLIHGELLMAQCRAARAWLQPENGVRQLKGI
jgi:hypothetical protein